MTPEELLEMQERYRVVIIPDIATVHYKPLVQAQNDVCTLLLYVASLTRQLEARDQTIEELQDELIVQASTIEDLSQGVYGDK